MWGFVIFADFRIINVLIIYIIKRYVKMSDALKFSQNSL